MSQSYGPPGDKQEMISVLRAAVDRGVTFFDTAQIYGSFANEGIVGEGLAPVPGQVAIASKFGLRLDANGQQVTDSSPEQIKHSAEGSLKRLQVEAISWSPSSGAPPYVPLQPQPVRVRLTRWRIDCAPVRTAKRR